MYVKPGSGIFSAPISDSTVEVKYNDAAITFLNLRLDHAPELPGTLLGSTRRSTRYTVTQVSTRSGRNPAAYGESARRDGAPPGRTSWRSYLVKVVLHQ